MHVPNHYHQALLKLNSSNANRSTDASHVGVMVDKFMQDYGYKGSVVDTQKGPTLTMVSVLPAIGERVGRFQRLEVDLQRYLAAESLRIQAPVPGQNVIGIEILNEDRGLVNLREIVETPQFVNATSKITFAIGLDQFSNPVIADLADMPHLLIAGATNSGKSVFLNNIITSIVMKSEPEEVKFCLIDPKRVELTGYAKLAHLWEPVVTDTAKAIYLLSKIAFEMDRRYKLFEQHRVRNIEGYNALGQQKLPYIVVVIDELADLMLTGDKKAVEATLTRLAQLARATGIHLVVATQRPSVNVITGVIKANFPSRVAFALPSHHDSRTILDDRGAEKLTGKGDLLLLKNGQKPVRLQGALLTDAEIEGVISVCEIKPPVAPVPPPLPPRPAPRGPSFSKQLGQALDIFFKRLNGC